MLFRGALLIASCLALATAAPAPQSGIDAFAGEGSSGAPALGTFLQTLSTVTNLLNRFSKTITGPAQYNEFDDVETAQPRVTLTEEKDAVGGSVYKVTIVRPADSGSKFARQMESTTANPVPPTATTSMPTQAPSQGPPTVPQTAPAPPAPPAPPTTTQSPAAIAAAAELARRNRIADLAWQLEQEENRQELEQDRREMELERRTIDLELASRRTAIDLEARQQEQERQLEIEERRRELQLEQALLDQERAVLGQLKVDPATEQVADQAAAGSTGITRIIHFESRENDSEERLLHALRQQNPNIQFVPRRAAPITTTTVTDQHGRAVRVRYESNENSFEDRLRLAGAPRLVQVGRNGAQPVYRFADSDEILYSAVQQPSQKATAAAQSPAPLVKQPLVVAPVALSGVNTNVEFNQRQSSPMQSHQQLHHQRHQQILAHAQRQQQQQPKYKTNHELFSEEEDQVDASALSPIMFLLKANSNPGQQQYQRHENFESLEDISRSGNRLEDGNDNDGNVELREFEKEWHFHPQPPQLADDIRVNRIFRTRNADFYNPEAETFEVPARTRTVAQQHPIK